MTTSAPVLSGNRAWPPPMPPTTMTYFRTYCLLSTLFMVGIVTTSQAQTTFGEQQIISTNADGARVVTSADLDGDGDMDVLSASRFDETVAWYENIDGLGSFGPQRVITTQVGFLPRTVVAVDLDGDGDKDVLTGPVDDGGAAWFENLDGLGNFGPPRMIDTSIPRFHSARAADFDGDGDQDILVGYGHISSERGILWWYENLDGQGSFGKGNFIGEHFATLSSILTADMDGDGDQDVLYSFSTSGGSPGQTIRWYPNTDGSGNFGDEQVITTEGGFVDTIFVADLDGDGDNDVLAGNGSGFGFGDRVAWYENLGDGSSFGPLQVISTLADDPASVIATDLDGDGDLDVLSASENDDKIAWYENTDGLGTFGPQQAITTLANGARSVFVADIDGDGDQDVLSASSDDDTIAWYENGALTPFGPSQTITFLADGARSVFAADLDGDGDQDVLSASETDETVAWYENDGQGGFGPQQVIFDLADGASSVFATDIDDDGDQDVLAAYYLANKIAWFENTDVQGAFGFQQAVTFAADGVRSVFAIDIDGDGDQDVLSASELDDKIAWYENRNDGPSGPPLVITTLADGASSVFAADLDGDGDPDVLSASFNDDKIAWYENTDGLGAFGPQLVITTLADGAESVFAADLDGDGDLDVLSASFNDDKIAWYENTDGLGAFGPQQILSLAADGARSVFASDLDGDGDQDVLSASSDDDKISWYENTDGLGSFGPRAVITAAAFGARSVFAADLDGDGNPDVLSAAHQGDEIAWYKNFMAASSPLQVTCTPVSPPIVIPAGGGNFDFDLEIVNNGASSETVDIWLDIDGPGVDRTRGPITRTLAAGASLMHTVNQNIPGRAPAGDYTNTCNVGSFPTPDASSSFDFEKSAAFTPGDVSVEDWSTEADLAAALSAPELAADEPSNYVLEANYPNPFNPQSQFTLAVARDQHVTAELYNVLGQRVATLFDGLVEANERQVVQIDGTDLASGVYVVRITGETFADALRVTLTK